VRAPLRAAVLLAAALRVRAPLRAAVRLPAAFRARVRAAFRPAAFRVVVLRAVDFLRPVVFLLRVVFLRAVAFLRPVVFFLTVLFFRPVVLLRPVDRLRALGFLAADLRPVDFLRPELFFAATLSTPPVCRTCQKAKPSGVLLNDSVAISSFPFGVVTASLASCVVPIS
jgi:hypothetical protein